MITLVFGPGIATAWTSPPVFVGGDTEGADCLRWGCEGVIEEERLDCSCHISPPCHSCTNPQLSCPECGWEYEEPPYVPPSCVVPYVAPPPLELDSSRVDWRVKSRDWMVEHIEGVYPPGTTRQEIMDAINACFGGRNFSMKDGRFKFSLYID